MFRKAQQSVAHQSTLPSGFTLGNRDLKSLQEVINTEKDFIKSNSRSAQDFHRSAEAIKTWSSSEGEDLHDVLGKLSLLFDSYGTAQTRLNAHLSTIRQHFKSVRTREEGLAELRSRKRALGGKIESVEKKLAKMGPENKELMRTTAQLKELRGEMESLRVEVQTEEAAIGDFKRRTAREAMGIKCGGLLELAEKLTIVAEAGKLMIEEISLEPTHPGMPRADYVGAMRTDQLLQEATRGIADVGFAPAGHSMGGVPRHDFGHHMHPSEMDDTTQDYYTTGNVTEDREISNTGWNEEQEEVASDHGNAAANPYDQSYEQQSIPPSNSGYSGEYRTTPIYAQHSSGSHVSQPVPIATQDTATDEWRKSRLAQQPNTPTRDAPPLKPNSNTPIADQFSSRSPDDIQVGGTGLHLLRSLSNESVERAEGQQVNGLHGVVSPIPGRISSPVTAHDSSEMYRTAAPVMPAAAPAYVGSSTPPIQRQFSSNLEHNMGGDDDDQYFQSVGSTRAAQQSVRRPLSPGATTPNVASANNSMSGHVPLPYEPQTEGRKMTAAAFRKGFGRVPSSQHQQSMTASTTSLGLAGSGGPTNEADTAPLAIRKRISVVPGHTAPNELGPGDYPAPPYHPATNPHHSIYGGMDDTDDMYAALPPPGPAAWGSRPNSRPTSAAGYRG